MKKSVGLLRISTELQTEKNGGTSLQIQHEKISQYIKLNDFEMVGMFEDVCSGGLETRDGIEKVIKLIKALVNLTRFLLVFVGLCGVNFVSFVGLYGVMWG